jgi:hypothetical protein
MVREYRAKKTTITSTIRAIRWRIETSGRTAGSRYTRWRSLLDQRSARYSTNESYSASECYSAIAACCTSATGKIASSREVAHATRSASASASPFTRGMGTSTACCAAR